MRRSLCLLVCLVVGIVAVAAPLQAQTPQLLNFQGSVLIDGVPPTEGLSVVFTIYDAESGGNALWTETQTVAFTEGSFNVLMGSQTAFPTDLFSSSGLRYVGVKIGEQTEMTPRFQLTSAAYALRASTADGVVEGSIGTQGLADGAVTATKLADGAVTGAKIGSGAAVKSINALTDEVTLAGGDNVTITAIGDTLRFSAVVEGGGGGDITGVVAGAGLTDGGTFGDVVLNVGAGNGISVSADDISLNTSVTDSRYVNEAQANAITSSMIADGTVLSADIAANAVTTNKIASNIISSIDGVTNDGGNINLVAGTYITIQPNDSANSITISSTGGGSSGNTLDQAYDQGGAGAGRVITADSGPVSVAGNDGLVVSGNVGAGTSSPQARLHVASGDLYIQDGDLTLRRPVRGSGGRALEHGQGDVLYINRQGDFAGGTRIEGSELRVERNLSIGPSDATVEGAEIAWQGSGSNPDWVMDVFDKQFRLFTFNASEDTLSRVLFFNAENGRELDMFVDGRIGVGIEPPEEKLDVSGTIYSRSGGFKFPDGSIQTTAATGGGGGGNTLDQAYDQGGAGAGRTIVADNGAVQIDGNGGLDVKGDLVVGRTTDSSPAEARLESFGSGLGLYLNQGSKSDSYMRYVIPAEVWWTVGVKQNNDYWISESGDLANNARFVIEKSSGNVGIGTTNPNYKLHVNGSVAGVGAYINLSDARYKKNIETIPDALDKVNRLRGVSYDWRREEHPDLDFADGRQLGLVAQEVKEVLPEVVQQDEAGVHTIAYGQIVPVLIEAMKEQQRLIDQQERELRELRLRMAAVESALKRMAASPSRSKVAGGE